MYGGTTPPEGCLCPSRCGGVNTPIAGCKIHCPPHTPLGNLQRSCRPLSQLRGLLLRGEEGDKKEEWRGGDGRGGAQNPDCYLDHVENCTCGLCQYLCTSRLNNAGKAIDTVTENHMSMVYEVRLYNKQSHCLHKHYKVMLTWQSLTQAMSPAEACSAALSRDFMELSLAPQQ